MRFSSRLLVLTALSVAILLALDPAGARADDTDEFLKTDNWEGLTQYWKLEGKTIIGETKEDPKFNTFFCSKKKYTDFEMSFKVDLKNDKGNSGVQIRSKLLDGAAEKGKFVVAGPQADMATNYWGSLYGEKFGGMMKAADAALIKKVVKPKAFNDYSIKTVGKKVTIKINDQTFIDEEFPKLPDDGIIAFQIHAGGTMTVTFKDIAFKDLSKK